MLWHVALPPKAQVAWVAMCLRSAEASLLCAVICHHLCPMPMSAGLLGRPLAPHARPFSPGGGGAPSLPLLQVLISGDNQYTNSAEECAGRCAMRQVMGAAPGCGMH